MNYQIKIIKTEPNPRFAEEMAAYREVRDRTWGNQQEHHPNPDKVKDVLICELTEEQFKKVKVEVLKAFE